VSELVGSVCFGVADIATDAIVCSRLLHGDVEVPNEGYTAAYVAVMCFGVVAAAVSLAYRLHNARQVRAQLQELAKFGRIVSATAAQRQAQRHEFELAQTYRTKAILSLSLLSIAVQGAAQAARDRLRSFGSLTAAVAGLPMSILNCYAIVIRDTGADKMVRASMTAWSTTPCVSRCTRPKQVLASLLISVLLVGIKLTAAKEMVQVIERRKELRANIALLQRVLEDRDKQVWIVDVKHDTEQREESIAELESASGHVYDIPETDLIEKGTAMFAAFESSSTVVKQLPHSATIMSSETKLDEATGLLLGRAAAMVRASPQEIVAYMLNQDSRHTKSLTGAASKFVLFETLQHVHPHHTIVFAKFRLGRGFSERTFLYSIVAKRVANDPPTYVLVGAPIACHYKITPIDEARAVRAENWRAFQLTEVAPGVTKLNYTCSLNLRGSIPQAITNKIAVPGQQHGSPLIDLARNAPARAYSTFSFLGVLQCRRRCSGTSNRSGRLPSATLRMAESSDTC
jgi:hypothetical protein